MAFELPYESDTSVIDPAEVSGAQALKVAEGLKIGVFKNTIAELPNGIREPVIPSSADNLKALALADFAIQMIVYPARYDTTELEDSINGRN